MLSYRHAFHAGNHADVLKHFVLHQVLTYFKRKDKPFWYIDTHSGAGCYSLTDAAAQKTGEAGNGIARLYAAELRSEALAGFVRHLRTFPADSSGHSYPGSPLLAQSLLRDGDKTRLFELHPADYSLLQQNTAAAVRQKRCIISRQDGYTGLLPLLPPPPRRAVVLIDPPYEQKQDYTRAVQTLKDALKRFAQGCYLLWYPCLSRRESLDLPGKLAQLLPENHLIAELHVHAPRADGFGMHGSGMLVLNPPYTLAQTLQTALPELTRLLAQDRHARFRLNVRTR